MARKKKAASGPNKAYLVSFGDTMTALLAFFIVLNSLATEQTGANLHSGTGSFMAVGDSAGVPGLFAHGNSSYAVQMNAASPLYIVAGDEESEIGDAPNGPDKDGDALTIQDREQDELERFLLEMEKQHTPKEGSSIVGEVAFDRMTPLQQEGALVDPSMRKDLLRFATVIRREGQEMEIRVWATTPAPSAWQRAADQADQLRSEVVRFLKLDEDEAKKLTTSASPWHSSDIKRPSLSFILRQIE